ncbi:hypothetical protein [Streptomyces sp. NPDC051554]|uniref:hypothetical protein n=1 Tax=Streptomyces sp. NPDC051554 TaxID=3365656 RepID=UPI0037975236
MTNFALTWAAPDGTRRASAVAYDEPSAAGRKKELVDAHCDDVQIVETKPGQLPEPAAWLLPPEGRGSPLSTDLRAGET